jgi:hypothetical protein
LSGEDGGISSTQGRCEEFLRCGLSNRTRDANERELWKALPPSTRELSIGDERVLNFKKKCGRSSRASGTACAEYSCRAELEDIWNKRVAVKIFTSEGDKKGSWSDFARVGGDGVKAGVCLDAIHAKIESERDPRCSKGMHCWSGV